MTPSKNKEFLKSPCFFRWYFISGLSINILGDLNQTPSGKVRLSRWVIVFQKKFCRIFARGVCIALQHYLEWGNGRLTPRIPPINSSPSSWRTLSHQIPLKPPKTLRKQISAKSNLILPTGCTCRTIVSKKETPFL